MFYLTLLVSLVYVSSAAGDGLAILRVIPSLSNFGDWRAASFCAAYNSNWTQNISTTPDLAEYFPVIFNDDGCSSSNVSSLDGMVSVVDRGNCSFQSKVTIAEEREVNGLLIVYNSSAVLPVPAGSNKSQLPVFMVTSTAGEFLQLHVDDGLVVGVYAPPTSPPVVDGSLAILFTIAMVTILLSAGFAAKPFAFLKRDLHQPEGGPSILAVATKESDNQESSGCASWAWKIVWIVVFVVFVCSFLLLLYFFYYPMVYIVIAMFSIGAALSLYSVLSPFVNLLPFVGRLPRNKIPLLRNRPDIKFFLTIAVSLGVVIWWIVERHASYAWVLHDLLGMTFIMMVSSTLVAVLDTWMVSLLLLVMMFYDIFFVFITPFITHDGQSVMVRAVTGGGGAGPPAEQLPIMFLAPKLSLSELEQTCGSLGGFSDSAILGYGDVAIPSLLVSLCLQFDLSQRSKSCRLRLYFLVCSIGYGVGLLVAFLVLTLSHSAQPALLYLVPSTLLPVLIVAAIRREFRNFLNIKQKKPSDGSTSINRRSPSPRSSHAESKDESAGEEEHKQLLESDHA